MKKNPNHQFLFNYVDFSHLKRKNFVHQINVSGIADNEMQNRDS